MADSKGITKNVPVRVRNLIKKAGTNKPKGIADYLKIRVRAADLPSSINSFCVTVLNKKYICISDQLNEASGQNKAVCRGIGYFVLGRTASELEIDYFENELYNHILDSDLHSVDSYLKIG